jgi:uncharacterized protein DUF3168
MEEALIALLLGDTALAALIAQRIFPASRPQASPLPAVTLQRIGGGPLYADDGEVGLEEARLQIDCWGSTYTSAKQVARAVTRRLSGFDGPVGITVFQSIELDAERDLREPGSNAADYPFRASLDFIIWSER